MIKKSIRFIMLTAAMLFAVQALWAAEPINYYNSALGKSDENLMSALRSIIRNHKEVSYSSGLLAAFRKADTDDDGFIRISVSEKTCFLCTSERLPFFHCM